MVLRFGGTIIIVGLLGSVLLGWGMLLLLLTRGWVAILVNFGSNFFARLLKEIVQG